MAFHVRDPETDRVVRDLARLKGVSLTEAIRTACAEKLARERGELPLEERIRRIRERLEGYGRTGLKADKAFYDSLNDEEHRDSDGLSHS